MPRFDLSLSLAYSRESMIDDADVYFSISMKLRIRGMDQIRMQMNESLWWLLLFLS